MDKFQRNYLLTVQLSDGSTQIIEPPFSLDFNIEKNSLIGGNYASFRVLNLSPQLRSLIRKDVNNYTLFRGITLMAGYGNTLSTVFNGNITNAYSVREGVNFATHMICSEGGFLLVNGKQNFTFYKNQSRDYVIRSIIQSMSKYGVTLGKVGKYDKHLLIGNSYNGSIADNLNDITGGGFSVQSGKAYCLGNTEYINGKNIQVIDQNSGILGTPVREQTNVRVDLLMEPGIEMLQGIYLNSLTGDSVNGFYKVLGLNHNGTISEAVCGQAVTRVMLAPCVAGLGI